MAETDDTRIRPPSRAMRDAAAEVIRGRPRAGTLAGVAMALVFAAVTAPLAIADRTVIGALEVGQPARATVRVAPFAGYHGPRTRLSEGGIVLARGEVATTEQVNLAREVIAAAPDERTGFLVFFAGFAVIALLYTTNLRRSRDGKLLRTQAVNLALIAACAVGFKGLLLATSVSALIAPVAALALLSAIVVDVSTGLATGLVAAAVFGTMVPLDLGVVAVLAIQAGAGALTLPERARGWMPLMRTGLFAGGAAAVAYAMIYFLANGSLPATELSDPARSTWVAAFAAGPVAAVVAMFGQGLYHRLLGDVSRDTLVDLADLSHPLLKQIAERSPGTWQHSLAMANMAESAANTIGANGRLVRTGAYYHDLGKSVQPKYFIENLGGDEKSPHDCLAPSVSCDAIFAHVTEGVRLAREHGLPERIIDFMHMHHGDGVLEYFWAKNLEQGNPDNLTEADFRYPGIRPQSKETAILAICDAVEAASRTLRNPDEQAIRNLVQRIVHGKLHLGQLDDSGMTMEDLRKVGESLVATVKHAAHGRIEYPWQREERALADGSQRLPAVAEPAADDAGDSQRVTNPMPIPRGRLSSLPPGADNGPVAPDREALFAAAGRRKPNTIELMKSGRGARSPLESVHDEDTAERLIVPTKDAIRPSRVPTEEHEVVIPPEAYPNDDTAPDAPAPEAGKRTRVDG